MSFEQTLDADAVDLRSAADLVVETHAAAPCAVIGAAIRVTRPPETPTAANRGDWRFGWGASGRLWQVPPAGEDASAPRATAQSIFDLASLTKPVTGLLLARLEREGLLSRGERLADVLPELAGTASAAVPLDLLACHRSGLEAHRELYVARAGAKQASADEIIARAADARRAECVGAPPEGGFEPVYSDLGYILLGAAMARRAGADLDELVSREVARPLGITLGSIRQLEKSEPMLRMRVVPTEEVAWRGGVVRGAVHDDNAWVLTGAASAGHAGLFADVWSVVRLGTSVLEAAAGRKEKWLRAADIEPVLRRRKGGGHTAGFDVRRADAPDPKREGETPASGQHFGPGTFGHLGFTGTSIWIDPDRQLVVALLTNRVHPTRQTEAIKKARPVAYDAVWNAMTAS
jgi:serine-type D-Ala-D-Ala carboxypeptidase